MGLKRVNDESEVGASSPDNNALHNSVDNKPGSSNYPLVLLSNEWFNGNVQEKAKALGIYKLQRTALRSSVTL